MNKRVNIRFFTRLTLTILSLTFAIYPQTGSQLPSAPQREVIARPWIERSLDSKLMGRAVPYRVILPAAYGEPSSSVRRYPVIYLLHGLYGRYDNWTEKTKVAEYASRYSFIVVTPEGGDGWYTDSATQPKDKFESYIIRELIPEVDAKFRTIADRDHRLIAGLSMGGYGSIKFGLKYPELFSLVGSFSGAIGGASLNEKNAGAIGKTVDRVLGPDDGDLRRANDDYALLRAMSAERLKMLPFIYLSCGTEDFLYRDNSDFTALLNEKKVPHEYRERPGAHNWQFWDDQVREFLAVADRSMKK